MRWLIIIMLLFPVAAQAADCQIGVDTIGSQAVTIKDAMKAYCLEPACTGVMDSCHLYQDGGGTGGPNVFNMAVYEVRDEEGATPVAWGFDGLDSMYLVCVTDTLVSSNTDAWRKFVVAGGWEAPTITAGVGYALCAVADAAGSRLCGVFQEPSSGHHTMASNAVTWGTWPASLTPYTPLSYNSDQWRTMSLFLTEPSTGKKSVIIIGMDGGYNLDLEMENEKALYNALVFCATRE